MGLVRRGERKDEKRLWVWIMVVCGCGLVMLEEEGEGERGALSFVDGRGCCVVAAVRELLW